MKKVLYLHGLESKQGGSKVDFLSSICLVCAPVLDYRDSTCFQNIHDLVAKNSFDLIIGSSMGGYLAFLMGEIFETPTILFNPALHSRSFEPNNCFKPQLGNTSHYIILGNQDDVIDPTITMKILQEIKSSSPKTIEIETIPEMGHRTPLDVFIAKVQPWL
jgi:predicted esterase YcpF (UPF0227 family)